MGYKDILQGLEDNTLQLESIDLSNQNLGTAGLIQFGAVAKKNPNKTVKHLDLSQNKISRLPKGIFSGFISLKKLTLNNNVIVEIELGALSTEAGTPLALEELMLINNPLKIIPEEITRITSLSILLLHDTGLTTLPSEIYALVQLHTLGLKNNRFATFPPFGEHLLSLTKLCFDGLPPHSTYVRYLFVNTLFQFSYHPNEELLRALVLLLHARINWLKAQDLEEVNFNLINSFLNQASYTGQYSGPYIAELFMQNNIPVIWSNNQFVVSRFEQDFIRIGSQLGLSEERDIFGGVWYGKNNNFSINTWGGKITDGIKWLSQRTKQFIKVLEAYQESDNIAIFNAISNSIETTSAFCSNNVNHSLDADTAFYNSLLQQGSLVILPAGSINHAIGLALLKHNNDAYVITCNRASLEKHNVFIYLLKNFSKQEASLSKIIALTAQLPHLAELGMQRLFNQIRCHTQHQIIFKYALKVQKHGNCTFANVKSLVFPLIILYAYLQNKTELSIDFRISESYCLYKRFTGFIREVSIGELLKFHQHSYTPLERQIKEKLAALHIVAAQKKFEKESPATKLSEQHSMLIFYQIFKGKEALLETVPLDVPQTALVHRFINRI